VTILLWLLIGEGVIRRHRRRRRVSRPASASEPSVAATDQQARATGLRLAGSRSSGSSMRRSSGGLGFLVVLGSDVPSRGD
jgi:hypothetical protein